MDQSQRQHESAPEPLPYEAPRIESVLEADDVAREVHYAGGITVV